jgi:hypothetical protein
MEKIDHEERVRKGTAVSEKTKQKAEVKKPMNISPVPIPILAYKKQSIMG